MRERFIGTAPGKESGVRENRGLFVVEQSARNSCAPCLCCRVTRAIPTRFPTRRKITLPMLAATGFASI